MMFMGLMVLQYVMLALFDTLWRYAKALHLLSLWFMVSVLTFELHYHVAYLEIGTSMDMIGWGVVALAFTLFVTLFPKFPSVWKEYKQTYKSIGAGGLVLFLFLWELGAFLVPAHFTGMGYFPLLNPIDLMQLGVWGAMTYWAVKQNSTWQKQRSLQVYGVLGVLAWVLLTVIFARFVQQSQGLDYTSIALWHSDYFQTGISILWSGVAILLMVLSKMYTQRNLWIAGFGLLILVVLKLFFVELAHSGTIERIVSFIVVGTLLLLIGYFVPMPPNEKESVK